MKIGSYWETVHYKIETNFSEEELVDARRKLGEAIVSMPQSAGWPFKPDGTPAIRRDSGNYKGIEEQVRRHVLRNKHHWEYWKEKDEPMPEVHAWEMLADWRGAGLANGKPDTLGWYITNRERIQLHQETRLWIEKQLGITR